MKQVLGYLRRADEEFGMISPGEKLAIGVSGGKDSMALLHALHLYQYFSKKAYTVHAFTVDLGFGSFDTGVIADYCRSLDIPHTVVQTNIAQIVFDARQETNPCALCAKLRKGALFTEITRQDIYKCVFAHHREDCLESFLMSLLYEGRLRTFTPVTYLERTGVTLIRPLILLPEKEIKAAVRRHDIPVAKNPCPASGQTKRDETKRLLAQISANNPHARERMLTAIHNTANYSLWD